MFVGYELNGCVPVCRRYVHMCAVVPMCSVVEPVACTPTVPLCVCLSWCVTMCVLLCAPGCVCLGGCLSMSVLCDVVGLRLCECLSDAPCVWQHVGLWTGLA